MRISLLDEPVGKKAKKFLSACLQIADILTSTEEWIALPEYEFLYE
ncbi:MAG TPA: hypothetical protein GX701_09545 [Clostridiales bacterium]|jgi:hypothetical protein|nr:hypothetical protein [Clostridiales bacterium]